MEPEEKKVRNKKMAIIFVFLLCAIGALIACGLSGEDGEDENGETTPDETKHEDVILTGSGDTVSINFYLYSGKAIFKMSHDGESNFIVELYDESGDWVDLIANEIGPYNGSQVVPVTGDLFAASPGNHFLQIDADGNWEIVIERS